jgi:hypothetical protein
MHQYLGSTARRANRCEPVAHRVLPCGATGRDTCNLSASKCCRKRILLPFADHDEYRQIVERSNGASDDRRTAQQGELFGHIATGTFSASGSNNKGDNVMHAARLAALAALRHNRYGTA